MTNNLNTSENFTNLMISFEKEVLKGYLDPVGIPTIGIGHVILKGEPYKVGQTISREESRKLFRKDTLWAVKAVNSLVSHPINQNQFDALVSLVFNIGENGFANSSVLREINRGNIKNAANAFALWNKSKGRILKGLVRRRKEEAKLFLTPYSASTPAKKVATTTTSDNLLKSAVEIPLTENVVESQSTVNNSDVSVKTVDPPPSDGTTATATKLTIAGLTVPPTLVALVRTIQDAIAGGFIEAKTIGDSLIGFLSNNYKYVFVGIGIFVSFLTIKKLFKQITLWLEMYFAASRNHNDVKVNKG